MGEYESYLYENLIPISLWEVLRVKDLGKSESL